MLIDNKGNIIVSDDRLIHPNYLEVDELLAPLISILIKKGISIINCDRKSPYKAINGYGYYKSIDSCFYIVIKAKKEDIIDLSEKGFEIINNYDFTFTIQYTFNVQTIKEYYITLLDKIEELIEFFNKYKEEKENNND